MTFKLLVMHSVMVVHEIRDRYGSLSSRIKLLVSLRLGKSQVNVVILAI